MKWERARQSQNIEDRRGRGPVKAGGVGIGAILIALIGGWLFGVDPSQILGVIGGMQGTQQSQAPAPTPEEEAARANDPRRQFVASILGETEDVWSTIFQQAGKQYPAPTLVLYENAVTSACGQASSAVGPFYCPGDQQVYIDLSFFREMQRRLGGGGDFAEAYVIAHEVGHHIQTLTGVSQRVNDARRRRENVEGDNGLLVRQELQADCYAGVWAHHAQARHAWLEEGDIEEAMNTASAIGDDALQKQSGGRVVPDAFTHGTAQQRVRWFTQGFRSGQIGACDTFAAATL